MKKLLLLLCVFSFAQAYSQAGKSTHYKAAEEYTVALNMEKTTNEGIDQMVDLQIKANPMLEAKKDVFKDFMRKYLSWSALREDYIKIYMDEFSEADLKDMTAFYLTPTGKKVAAKQNVIMMKSAQLGQDKMQANMSELMQLMQ